MTKPSIRQALAVAAGIAALVVLIAPPTWAHAVDVVAAAVIGVAVAVLLG